MREAQNASLPLPELHDKNIGSWCYAAGRIRSLEKNLFGQTGLDRLFAAETLHDVRMLMQEHRYPQEKFEQSIAAERLAIYSLLQEIAPEDGYRVALVLFNDAHQLKLMLKERLKGDEGRSLGELKDSLLSPTLVEAQVAYETIAESGFAVSAPHWLTALVEAANTSYAESYDAAAIDRTIDQRIHLMAQALAEQLGNKWFEEYFSVQRDLINWETLLRVRLRRSSLTQFKESLLPEGVIALEDWLELFEAEDDVIAEFMARTPYKEFVKYLESYGLRGQASALARDRDQFLLRHIEKGRHALAGPELVLSYILVREYEIKNLRFVVAAIRNQLTAERRRSLRRQLWP